MSESPNKKRTIITISIIVVLLFILAIMIAIKVVQNKNSADTSLSSNIKIDNALKQKLSRFVDELSTGTYCEFSVNKEFANDCLYRNPKTMRGNLTKDYRVYSLVLAIGYSDENNIMVGNLVIDGKVLNNPNYVNLSDVKKEYKLLYGDKEEFDPNIINNISKESIIYDESKEKFFYQEQEPTAFIKTHIEDYDSTPEEVNVYLRVGYITYENYKYHLYNDKNKTKELASLTSREYKEGSIINDKNYTELPKFKATFMIEDDSDNLVFKSIELVS